MIKAVFRGKHTSVVDIVWGQRISLKIAIAQALGLDDTDMILVDCDLFGPKYDAGDHHWTLHLEAPDREGRSANRIAKVLKRAVQDLVGEEVVGVVVVSLANMGFLSSRTPGPGPVAAVMESL